MVNKRLREQHMCFAEFLCNIDELEQVSKKKVDPNFIHLLNIEEMMTDQTFRNH